MQRNYTSIRLEITSKCNMNCLCCHNEEYLNKGKDMSTDEILILVRNLKMKYDIRKVLLTGGEPLMKPDICKIIEKISDMGIKVDMVTNGTMLTYAKVKELQAAGLKRIRLSIDEVGDTTQLRDFAVPNELWEKAEMIVENTNIEVCIHTVASTYNVEHLYEVYKKVIEVGAARWRIFDIGYQGGVVNKKEIFDFKNYYEKLVESSIKIIKHYLQNNLKDKLDIEINNVFKTSFLYMDPSYYEDFDINRELAARLKRSPCDYVANHQISIRSDGSATLCQYFHNKIYDYAASNFSRYSLNEKNYVVENELIMSDLPYCSQCKYCLVCNSGCRSRAEYLTGNIKDADPVGCYLHQMVHKQVMTILPDFVYDIYSGYISKTGLEPKYTEEDLKEFLSNKGYTV